MKRQKPLIMAKLVDIFNEKNNLILGFKEHSETYHKILIPVTDKNKELTNKVSEAFFIGKSPVNLIAIYGNNHHRIAGFLLGLLTLSTNFYKGLLESYEYNGALSVNNEFFKINVISKLGGLKYKSALTSFSC